MTILMWISRWQNEMELMIMGLQIILFLFLTIGVFCIVAATRKKQTGARRRWNCNLKKHMDKAWEKGRKKCNHRRKCKIKIYMRMRKKTA